MSKTLACDRHYMLVLATHSAAVALEAMADTETHLSEGAIENRPSEWQERRIALVTQICKLSADSVARLDVDIGNYWPPDKDQFDGYVERAHLTAMHSLSATLLKRLHGERTDDIDPRVTDSEHLSWSIYTLAREQARRVGARLAAFAATEPAVV